MINSITGQNISKYWATVIMLFLITACGSAPARLPAALEQAKKADQAAHRALRDGDLLRAREMFNQSMLMQHSLENIPAAAIAAINLSSVEHKLGDNIASLALLDGVLTDDTALVPAELKSAAAFRKGVILADNNRDDEALSAVNQSGKICINPCALTPGINNLQARLLLKKGEYANALNIVNGVMNSGAADKEELANARRIAGAAESALGQHQKALAHYNSALELDKELAISMRIAEDLTGISKSLQNQGLKAEADIYARRAEMVIAASRMLNSKTKNENSTLK